MAKTWTQLLKRIQERKSKTMITLSGKPVAVLIPYDDYVGSQTKPELVEKLRAAGAIEEVEAETLEREVPAEEAAQRERLLERLEEQADTIVALKVELALATDKERLYSHEEVWAEIEALENEGALPD
ncbi:MAG: hypothetical protein M5U01_15425 [Ardenticatenaceae bacterium]|nr:hypothetical protein [Ardenticatenaceae bacterium]HBY97526.1 hypothetical protein [Chloroflexota bacterium]